jgi:hypothetical protein
VIDAEPAPFFAIFSHKPRDEAWWVANHSDQARAVANESTGRSLAVDSACEAIRPPSSLAESSDTLLFLPMLE